MATQDLVVIADARSFLKIDDGETDRNTLLAWLITAASDAIMEHCQRQFAPSVSATTYTFRWEGGILDLSPYDLRTATTVQIDTDGTSPSPTTLTADDYRLLPNPTKHGVYTQMELRGYDVPKPASNHTFRPSRQVSITGNWGFSSVPEDVQLACLMAVAHLERTWGLQYGQGFDGDTDRFGPVSLPSAALTLLDKYRRVPV